MEDQKQNQKQNKKQEQAQTQKKTGTQKKAQGTAQKKTQGTTQKKTQGTTQKKSTTQKKTQSTAQKKAQSQKSAKSQDQKKTQGQKKTGTQSKTQRTTQKKAQSQKSAKSQDQKKTGTPKPTQTQAAKASSTKVSKSEFKWEPQQSFDQDKKQGKKLRKKKERKKKEPKVKAPKVKEPKVKERKKKEPKVKAPKVKEPKVKERKKKEPKKKGLKRALLIVASILIVLAVSFGALVSYVSTIVPDITDIDSVYSNIEISSVLYDSDGKEIDKLYYTEDRETVSINDISENTKNAFIAIEDKTFYKHPGINAKRMIGAVLSKITGRSEEISGTSTITQQLARNVFLADIKSQRTLKRKLSEIAYALKIERTLSKDEILEAYLNTIYLGYGCYGIDAAARTYFGKSVDELTLAESAALAALPQAPDMYALLKDEKGDATTYLKKYGVYANDLSKERRDLVLDLMAEQGFISNEEAEEAKVDIKDILKPEFEEKSREFTYFTSYVTDEVTKDLAEEYSISEEEADRIVHTGGLHIYSTADREIQEIVDREFSDDYNFPYSEEEPQAAMVITEVGTGKILAMAGGRDPVGQNLFNRATSPRQPGSSIKPLAVYSAGLQKSYEYYLKGMTFPFVNYGIDRQGASRWGNYITAGSTVVDERLYINGEVWPQNFSRSYTGYKTFRTALQLSINTCAVKIQMQVGSDYSIDMLKKYGISTVVDDTSQPVNDYNPAALALGAMTYGVTPLDMALAYATFPNEGVRNSGISYTKVTDKDGNIVLANESETTEVLDKSVAWIMTDCLKTVVSRGIGRNAYIYGAEPGGKTGTTNDNYDYWFAGFTPKYSAALWIGTDHNTVMGSNSGTAALLWGRIMGQIPDITEGEYPEAPEDIIMKYGEYYIEGTEP